MGGRTVAMKEGDEVEERKKPNRACKILRVHESTKDGKPTSFVVSFDGDSKEHTRNVTQVQRRKLVSLYLHGKSHAGQSCAWLRKNKQVDPNYRSLDLQLVLCRSCNAQKPKHCNRHDEIMDMFNAQLQTKKGQQQEASNDGTSEHHYSCKWLRQHGKRDPKYDIDVSRVMCTHCERGDQENCSRMEDAVALVMKSKGGKKRKLQPKYTRFSFPSNQLRATGRRIQALKPKADSSEERRNLGQSLAMVVANAGGKCLAITPSKVKIGTMNRICRVTTNVTHNYFDAALPNMNADGRKRLMAQISNKDARRDEKKASAQLNSDSGTVLHHVELRELRANTMFHFVNMLKDLPKVIQRPFLAAMSMDGNMKRKKAELVCDMVISKRQWRNARSHAISPGPFVPVQKVKLSRARVKVEKLMKFMEVLESVLQAHAVGINKHTLVNGEEQVFDRMSMTKDQCTLMRDYAKLTEACAKDDGTEIPADEDRCTSICGKNGLRCMLRKDHNQGVSHSRCKFTPNSMLSPSSIEKIVDTITSGSLKSLAGLDDEDVIKGHNNFKRLLQIAEMLCVRLQKSTSETEAIKTDIKNTQVFTDTSFTEHTNDHAEHICGCISCGYTSPQDSETSDKLKSKKKKSKKKRQDCDSVACPYRANGTHKGPCKDCEKSFEIFTTLLGYAEEADQLAGATEVEKEEFYELGLEINERRRLLIELRSHKVRKKTESDYDRQQLQSLKPNECIVISDFKMKILAMYHRENQRLFFGKRGIACLGFMVITPCADSDDGVNVHFYLFFSNDTTQDANFVLSAKAALYGDILPTLFPDDIREKYGSIYAHFRCDGAGCFNCNSAKAAMYMWKRWTSENSTPVNEVSYRVAVNGGGKTSLDGKFGHIQASMKTSVNNGFDITSAETCVEAYEHSSGIRGTTSAIFTPIRDSIIETNMKGLTGYYHLKKNDETNSLQGFRQSGYGNGVEILIKDIDASWATETKPPEMPTCTVKYQTETKKSTEAVIYSTEGKASRDKRYQEEKSAMKQKERDDTWDKTYHENAEKGVHRCNYINPLGKKRCICSYLSRKALDAHMTSGKHKYPSQNVVDSAVSIVANAGGIMASGSHHNRLAEYDETEVHDGEGLGKSEGTDWHNTGCYLKPGRRPNTVFKQELKIDLLSFYLDGEKSEGGDKKGKSKYTKEEAFNKLNDMRRDGGFRKYSSRSEFGPLPTVEQIVTIFQSYKKERAKVGIDGMEQRLASLRCNDANHGDPSNEEKPSNDDKKSKSNLAKKRKSEEKDTNAPKKPRSAQNFYAQSIRAQVKKENPNLVAAEITKEVSARWKSVDEGGRAEWQVMAKKAKEKYNKDLAEYKKMKCEEFEAKNKCEGPDTAAGNVSFQSTELV